MVPLPVLRRMLLPGFIMAYILLSLYVMALFIPRSTYGQNNTVGLPKPPIAYRLLVPAITDAVNALIPKSLADAITPGLIAMRNSETGHYILRVGRGVPWPDLISDQNLYYTFLKMVVVYAMLLAFIWMQYVLTKALLPQSRIYALLAPVVGLGVVSCVIFNHGGYTYDFAELFFSSACFYLLFRRRWRDYLVCLVFAILAKDSALFAILFFCVWFYHQLPRRQYLQLAALQFAIYLAIEITLRIYFSDRTPIGGGLPFIAYQFSLAKHHLFNMLADSGYYSFMSLLGTVLLVAYRWPEKPLFLRAGLWMVLFNAVVYVLCCNVNEYRDLYWCMPVVMIMMTHTIVQVMDIAKLPVFEPVT